MNNINQEQLITNIAHYYANGMSAEEVLEGTCLEDNEDAYQILVASQSGWEQLPCDAEGASVEQEEAMDNYLESIAQEILKIK